VREAWDNVETLLKGMATLLIESGVPSHQVMMPQGRKPEEIKLEKYVEAFDWLHRLRHGGAWIAVEKAKALRPQEIWDAYKAHGFKNLQEQIILERAQEQLRKAWRTNRPSIFGRIYNEIEEETEQDGNSEGSEGECVRSKEAGTDEGNC
jgi:hypothetical protein